jgi:hypothetical protein
MARYTVIVTDVEIDEDLLREKLGSTHSVTPLGWDENIWATVIETGAVTIGDSDCSFEGG